MDKLLQPEVQQFIKTNADADITKLLLKGGDVSGVSMALVVEQIVSRNKAKSKVPFLYNSENVVFPPKLSMEQCSSEKTAEYKSNLVQGKFGADLTGGAGVDSIFLSKKFEQFNYIERNSLLADIASNNFDALDVENITTNSGSAEHFLEDTTIDFDLLFIDPARRDDNNKKVFKFADCTPNVIDLMDELLAKSTTVMVKASPLMDIKLGIAELGNVKEVHVVAVNNECKELLFILTKNLTGEPKIVTANYKENWHTFSFNFREEALCESHYSAPQKYLYEPNVALLKAGAYKIISKHFGINKLHPNSHLYTSEKCIEAFPGRTFEIEQVLKYDKKALAKAVPSKKANITCRNFPDSVQKIRKKTKIKEGGNVYLFATTDLDNNHIILKSRRL